MKFSRQRSRGLSQPKECAAFIKSEVETNTQLLKDAGYKPE